MAAMAVIFKYAICLLLIENAVGQYGPFPSGKTRHRTTTTTETPDVANEVLPPSPYQPPSGYKPPGSPSQPPLPSPYPSPQDGQPTPPQPTPSNQPPQQPPSSQPSSDYPYPSQPSPSQPPPPHRPTRPEYPPSPSGQPSPGQTTPQFPTPGQQPSSQYPTPQYPKPSGQPQSPSPSGQPSPYPTSSGQTSPQYPTPSGQPSPQYPTPSGQPSPQYPTPSGQPSSQYPTSSGQPSPQYPTPSGQPSSQYPTSSGQPSPQYPTPSGQPSSQYPTPSGQTSPQYPTPSGQPSSQYPTSSGQPSPQYPTPSGQPSPQYPTPSGQPSPQQPVPSGQPSSQHPSPSGQPQYPFPSGQPSTHHPSPTGQPTPQFPSQPGQSPPRPTSPQYPPSPGSQFPGQPAPQYPAPSSPGQPSPQYPGYTPEQNPSPQFPSPSGQPSAQYPAPSPGQPSPQYPGPSSSPQFPSSSGQPSTQYPAPLPGRPSPQYPGYTPGPSPSPSQQYWWANPQNPFTPGQQPTAQPIAPPPQGTVGKPPGSPCSANLANNPFISSGCSDKPKPQQPALGPPNRPGFPPQPQQPLPSPSRPQPGYGPQPATPSQVYQPQPSGSQQAPQPQTDTFPRPIPQRPSQNPINPNNPFLSSGLQNPVRQEASDVVCNTETAYCVPSYKCNNGLVTDPSSLPANLKKGPCSPGEVCCKVKKHTGPPSYPPQPQPSYPSQPQPYAVTETPKYTGPLNTTPYPGCAAALKCVDISYCTIQGVMSNTPVALTREESENRVPLTDCQDMNTGIIGKCCRDPNYKDPWPAGMMMPAGSKNLDDGQYHPPAEQQFDDGQYHPSPEQGEREPTTIPPYNSHTIKLPLGVFKQTVTPFPIGPRPGQTHEQVFPGNEDKLYGTPALVTPYHPSYPQSQSGQPQQSGTPTYQPQPSKQPTFQSQPSQPSTYQAQPSQQPTYQPQPSQQPTYQPQPQQPGSKPYLSQSPYQPQPSQPQPQQPSPTPQSGYSQPPSNPSQSPQPTPGKECGVRRPNQGAQPDEAGFGEFPWHATIVSSSNNSALCSAAIIAPNAVITSAHCIDGLNPEDMKIKAGGHTLGQEGPKPSQIRPVGAAAIHPSYDSGSLVKDQAIIVTDEPLVFDQHIDKVCLAPSSQEEYEPSGGDCFVTGYGRPALQRNTPGTPLHKIKVNLIPKEQCENNLKKTHLGKYFILNKGFTCAAPIKESELCKVDVGSPLVCERPDGHYELAGVYSWDTKCSTALPGVMASCDTEWIQQVLATPLEKLREQYARPQIATHLVIDIDSKPGFALGYGK